MNSRAGSQVMKEEGLPSTEECNLHDEDYFYHLLVAPMYVHRSPYHNAYTIYVCIQITP